MNYLNSVLIEGNLVRDPENRTTPKGTALCKFSVACNRFYKTDNGIEKEVSYIDVETWGKLAEKCGNLARKGRGVRVVGRLKQDRWQSKDSQNQTKVFIVAEHVEFRPDSQQNQSPVADENGDVNYADEAEGYEVESESLVPCF